MTTAYTSLLGLALPVTGELSGTWGDVVNTSITGLLDSAVAGATTLSTDGDVTLSTTTGAANQARQAILLCTGARTAQRTITAPAQSKVYVVINATTGGYAVKLVGSGPTTGVTIPAGTSAIVAWNGSDFVFANSISQSLSTPATGSTGTLAIGDRGALVQATGTITVPNGVFAANDVVTIANTTGSSITISQGSGLTLRFAGTSVTGSRTLAQYGLATVVFLSASTALISGGGLT
jgi:hypothetical protein